MRSCKTIARLLALIMMSPALIVAAAPASAPTPAPATQAAPTFEPITLRANAIAPEAALAKIADQTGAVIVTDSGTLFNDGQSPAAMFLDVRRQPFWIAMDQVCRAARVGVRGLGNGDAQIAIFQRNEGTPLWGDRPAVAFGPALFISESVTRTDHRDFVRAKSADPVAQVSVDVWTDPRLNALTIAGPVRVSQAVDEAGVALPRDPSDTDSAGGPNGARWAYRMNLRLLIPPNAGQRIARLRGEVRFVIVTKQETWTLDKLADAKGKTHTILGYPVEIKEIKIGTGSGEVSVRAVRGDRVAQWGSFLQQLENLTPQIQLLDDAGMPMHIGGWGSSSSDQFVERNVNFSADNNDKAKPAKMVWVVPTETRELTVPFELKDLVLP